jgi:hypothetical protein
MSIPSPEEHGKREQTLTPTESADLTRLEAVAQRGLGTYVQVGAVLAEIRDRHLYRDSHPSFEAYLRERWADDMPKDDLLPQTTVGGGGQVTPSVEPELRAGLRPSPCEVLGQACEETMAAFAADDRLDLEIRLAVRKRGDLDASADPSEIPEPLGDELVPTLRWLLTKASGTIGLIAHHLETRAADIDDGARAQLRDDVGVVEDELITITALLAGLIDWDSEFGRLLEDELPPFDTDTEIDDD